MCVKELHIIFYRLTKEKNGQPVMDCRKSAKLFLLSAVLDTGSLVGIILICIMITFNHLIVAESTSTTTQSMLLFTLVECTLDFTNIFVLLIFMEMKRRTFTGRNFAADKKGITSLCITS